MSRLLTPAILLAIAAYVQWFNAGHDDRAVFLPFADVLVPSTKGDPIAMGRATVQILAIAVGLTLAWALAGMLRDAVRARKAADAD